MKLGHLFLVCFLWWPFILDAQKLKDRTVSFSYLKAPLTPMDLPGHYDFCVKEENRNNQGVKTVLEVYSGDHKYDTRSSFYKSASGLGNINGFKVCTFNDTSVVHSRITLSIGLLDVHTKDVVQNGTIPDGNPGWCYKMQIKLPIAFSLKASQPEPVYERFSDDTVYVYHFPADYKPLSSAKAYGTTGELETYYQANRTGFLTDLRNDIVSKWIYQTKMDVSSRFTRQRTDARVDIHWIKEKKGGFEDVDVLVAKMDTLFNRLDANYHDAFKTNWHSTEYREEFIKIATEWKALFDQEVQRIKLGHAPRFDSEMNAGLYKNYLWCRFFGSEMDEVIRECETMESDRIADPAAFGMVSYSNLLDFARDYKARYEANPGLFELP